jgi:hypothetical protein
VVGRILILTRDALGFCGLGVRLWQWLVCLLVALTVGCGCCCAAVALLVLLWGMAALSAAGLCSVVLLVLAGSCVGWRVICGAARCGEAVCLWCSCWVCQAEEVKGLRPGRTVGARWVRSVLRMGQDGQARQGPALRGVSKVG